MTRCVIAGIDGSAASLAAARWAADEAVARGAVLRLVHAAPLQPQMLPTVSGADVSGLRSWDGGAERMLRRTVAELAGTHPDLEVEGRQVTDTPGSALASQGGLAELVVIGSRGGGGFPELLVGSVALEVAGRTPCPVAVLPPETAGVAQAEAGTGTVSGTRAGRRVGPPANGPSVDATEVVLAIDARDPADEVIDFAFQAALRRGAGLRAVHAWSMPQAITEAWVPFAVPEEDRGAWEDQEVQLLSDALAGWRDKYPTVPVVPDVVLFTPARAVVNASRRAGLLVVGRRAAAATLGPTAHAALHHGGCAVVVVPYA